MNKKGVYSLRKVVFFAAVLFVVVFILLAFYLLVTGYEAKLVHVPIQLKAEMVSLRFVNIPECFAYQDEGTKRIYPGVVELSKFNEEQMAGCYVTETEKGNRDLNFRLLLHGSGREVQTNNYFNKDDFTLKKKVVVREGSDLKEDLLLIFVQVKV